MQDYVGSVQFTKHAKEMIIERKISEEWISAAILNPERIELGSDGLTHFIKSIPEFEDRVLRVIIDTHVLPKRVITLFFDRRLK